MMHEGSVTPAQLRAGRVLLGLSQADLAERASVTVEAIAEAEPDGEPGASEAAMAALQAALERHGVIFLAGCRLVLIPHEARDSGVTPDFTTP